MEESNSKYGDTYSIKDVVNELKNEGDVIETVTSAKTQTTGIKITPSKIQVGEGETVEVTVTPIKDAFSNGSTNISYYMKLGKSYYKMIQTETSVDINDTPISAKELEDIKDILATID